MDVDINYWAVLLAAISSMVVGSIWYMPSVFGGLWMKYTKVKMNRSDSGAKMAWMYGTTFVASLITAYVIAHISFIGNQFFHDSFLASSLQAAFWLWLGFTATRMYVHDVFEGRRKKLTLLNVTHELVTVLVMGLIIGLLKP